MDFMRKVGNFLKKTKVISKVDNLFGAAGVPYAGAIGKAAGTLGYEMWRRLEACWTRIIRPRWEKNEATTYLINMSSAHQSIVGMKTGVMN